jgi:hypothetical protein
MGRKLATHLIAATALGALFAGTAGAETPHSAEIERLRAQIEQRDAVIDQLLRRVEALERHLPGLAAGDPQAPSESAALAPSAPPAPSPPAQAQAPAPPPGPGTFEVDPEAAERALERSLAETGALLLSPGQAEIAPRFTFRRDDESVPVIVTHDGEAALATFDRRRDTLEGRLDLRLGLPFESQLELGLPYRHVFETDAVRIGLQPYDATRRSGGGVGDVRLAVAKTLLREEGWRPDLVGRFAWHAPTAQRRAGGVALGGGFHGFEGELLAVKRLDPLVFVASGSATTFLRRDRIEPGNQYAFSLGAFLAASPEASIRMVIQQVYVDETRIAGQRLPGSDRLAATFTAWASVILGARTLIDVAGDIGITEDAPAYAVRLGLTHRFDMPWR